MINWDNYIGRNKRADLPLEKVVDWDITSRCNYKCSYCLGSGSSLPDNLKKIKEKNPDPLLILDNLFKKLSQDWNFNIGGAGEPFLAPNFLKVIEKLVEKGHGIGVVSNFSFSKRKISQFFKIAADNLSHFNASLHLEQADLSEFLEKSFLAQEFIGNRFSVLSVARKGRVSQLKKVGEKFKKNGIRFTIQLEKDYYSDKGPYVEYNKEEASIIGDFRKDLSSKEMMRLKGNLCWAGSKYFVLDERGEAWCCYTARKAKDKRGYSGNILDNTFELRKSPNFCRYEYCTCIVPVRLGLVDRKKK
ncbi:MAG: hypothetical protein ABH889_01665 [Candidatus Portnoybacteria bacterium]